MLGLDYLFDVSQYSPRWLCGHWTQIMGWTHIISDTFIFLAYIGIPVSLLYYKNAIKDIPINYIFYFFAAFIFLCGTTHLIEVIIFWKPIYNFAGLIKFLTALVSVITLVIIFTRIPMTIKFIKEKLDAQFLKLELESLKAKEAKEAIIAKEKLQKNYHELQEMHQALKSTQIQLVQHSKMASLGQLSAGMAHEINNPIAYVTSNFEILKDYFIALKECLLLANKQLENYEHKKTDWHQHWVEKNIDSILQDADGLLIDSLEGLERVRDIIKDLNTFAHSQTGDMLDVNINQSIDLTVKIVQTIFKDKCTIHKNYGQIPLLRCYPSQINQVLLNILVNAGQAIEKKGEIFIQTESNTQEIIISISDTGIGITPENMDKLFDPFFSTKEVGKGTGLGLSISYNIIKNHGGKIEATSHLNEGSTFVITLPLNYQSQEVAGKVI